MAAMAGFKDPSSLANYGSWRTSHVTADLRIDFDNKCLRGSVVLDLESLTDRESREIVLDSSYVDVRSVSVDAAPAPAWELGDCAGPLGQPLRIKVPDGAARGQVVKLGVELATTDKCTALQWLKPEQTSNRAHPYLFSQCQAIHARSLFPCQDTPSVKSTFTFKIASPLPVIASGILQGQPQPDAEGSDNMLYHFEQKVPVPSYLFALASGDIVLAPIGPRSDVAASPDWLSNAQWEFEEDMERFLEAAESIIFPYKWGRYNVLVLPPSFPYGGMENPIFTFATPTIVSRDRQNVHVIAHELAHSWSGNLVTNSSWEHFWLNEGWTVYLERRIGAATRGPLEFDFSAIIGWEALEDAIGEYGPDHEFTKLIINHEGIDPDEAFSTVAYEKGFHFLWHLDRLVGRENFDKFIPHYFEKWSGKSLNSWEFKDTFVAFFDKLGDEEVKQKVATIDWDGRLLTPGLPPKPEFDTTLANECYKLAEKWKDEDWSPSSTDIESFSGNQKLVFLEKLQRFEKPLSPARAHILGKTYDLAESQNAELLTAYYQIALRARDVAAYDGATRLMGQVGRMKFVRPVYKALKEVDAELARRVFRLNEDFYHPICRNMVAKDLGL